MQMFDRERFFTLLIDITTYTLLIDITFTLLIDIKVFFMKLHVDTLNIIETEATGVKVSCPGLTTALNILQMKAYHFCCLYTHIWRFRLNMRK